jgi:endonuclease-3
MMMTVNYKIIEDYLDYLIPNPVCELNYFNDYSLLIAIMLSAQTTDKRVNLVTKELFGKYKSLQELKMADIEDLKRIIKPLGSYNKKASNVHEIATIICDKYNGIVPEDRNALESLPGIGRKTVNVYFSEYLSIPAIAVDTHVLRVSKRLNLAKEEDNVLDVEKHLRRIYKKENWNKRHLQMVLFGRYKCKAISPECDSCKLKEICKYYKKK